MQIPNSLLSRFMSCESDMEEAEIYDYGVGREWSALERRIELLCAPDVSLLAHRPAHAYVDSLYGLNNRLA